MSTNNLTEGKINTSLLRFAFPFLLAYLLQALYGATDLFVVGQFNNSAQVAAVAIGSQVMQIITGIVLGISVGVTVLIGRCVGEKNNNNAAKAIGTTVIVFSILAIILTPIMLFFTNPAISLMNTPIEAVKFAEQYLVVCACGIPFIIGYNVVSAIFRGLGDSKTPVYFIVIACILNLIMNFILVGAFKLGAFGSAISTVTAQSISFLMALLYILKKGFPFEFHKRHLRIDAYSAKYILKVGSPLALQDALVNFSFLIITAIINPMGLIASASIGVVDKIIGFVMLPQIAFASAVATMTAHSIGAGKPDRATKVLRYGISYSLIFGVAICIYSQFLPQTITGIFTKDTEIIRVAALYLKSFSIDCILVSFVFCMNSYFSGCGKSVISLIHSMVATFGVRIPVSYALSKMEGVTLYEMGFAAPTASLVSLIICFIYFMWIRRKKDEGIELERA